MFPCEIFWEVQSLIILNAMVHVFFLLQPMAPRPQEGVSYEREPEAERSAALSVGLGEGGTRDAADASGLISNLAEHECRKIEYVNIFTFDNHVCTIEPFTVCLFGTVPLFCQQIPKDLDQSLFLSVLAQVAGIPPNYSASYLRRWLVMRMIRRCQFYAVSKNPRHFCITSQIFHIYYRSVYPS